MVPQPSDGVLDHEQGHMDIEQQIVNMTQSKVNQMIKNGQLKGTGATDALAMADLEQKIANVAKAVADSLQKTYEDNTKHGTDSAAQAAARADQKKALNPTNNPKKAAEANTSAGHSLHFSAATHQLSISGDVISSLSSNGPNYVPSISDAVIGAEVKHPTFTLAAHTADDKYFFTADGANPHLTIEKAGAVLFSTGFDSLMYDPAINIFYGLGKDISFADGFNSGFLSTLSSELTSGNSALYCTVLSPDVDFGLLTSLFSSDGTSPMTDIEFASEIAPVPEIDSATGSIALSLVAGVLAMIEQRGRRVTLPA